MTRFSKAMGLVLAAAWILSAVGCGSRSSSNTQTGILALVTLDDSAKTLDGQIERIEFHMAYLTEDGAYVLNDATTDAVRDVRDRSLVDAPWKELITRTSADITQLKVFVLGYEGTELKAWGQFTNPEMQDFLAGKIVSRTIALLAVDSNPPPFEVTDLGCFIDISSGDPILRSPQDWDCDGFKPVDLGGKDCNDGDPNIGPGAQEICANNIDDNCNGLTDEETDNDHDGVTNCAGDCNDNDESVYPGAPELCDGKDNDCDRSCDNGIDDQGKPNDNDHDGWTWCGTRKPDWDTNRCVAPNSSLIDCMDQDPNTNPGAEDICDGKNNNCNGACDEGQASDFDQDGFTWCGSKAPGMKSNECVDMNTDDHEMFIDCKDNDESVYPGAPELCDGKDNDCDNICDEGFDEDGDGWNRCGSWNGTANPADCPQSPTASDVDCDDNPDNDSASWTYPGAPEICDGFDNDCNSNTFDTENQQCFGFADNGSACKRGTTTCQEGQDPLWSQCALTNTDPLPDKACDIYNQCVQDEPWDPWTCTTSQMDLPPRDAACVVMTRLDVNDTAACTEHPRYRLPDCTDSCGSCEWDLYAPDSTLGWTFALWEGGQQADDTSVSTDCTNVWLMARPADVNAAQQITVYLAQWTDKHAKWVFYQVTVQVAQDVGCISTDPRVSGLSCSGL
ncbi:MAG: putative metal-binding motif-containing protein [Deltaproteobacteria bacterium]|nr:putative metal-binding motif-containing protein [Deltaproteobacteria bacterium]